MMKSLVFILSIATLTHAWTPPFRLEPSALPKALSFADNAWHFPLETMTEMVGGSGMLTWRPEETTVKRPWSQKTTMDDSDHYYFDGFSGTLMHWPSTPAFVPKTTALSMPPRSGDEGECVEEYYDISGEPLCWFSTRRGLDLDEIAIEQNVKEDEEEDWTYFDDTGDRTWRDYEAMPTTARQESVSHSLSSELDEEANANFYHW